MAAHGQSPNPDEAYREAIKAVEVAAIAVVMPNDATATLGKVIGTMRQSPSTWTATLTTSVAAPGASSTATPVEVVIQMMDLLWRNHTDRHGVAPPTPAVPVTHEQAEVAVHLALVLVQLFRSGAIYRI